MLMDPWCFPLLDEIASGKLRLRCPVQMLHTEMFHPSLKAFESWPTIIKLMEEGQR